MERKLGISYWWSLEMSNKTISKEAAKLLGVPFQWPVSFVLRYVRTPEGFAVERYHKGWQRIGDERAIDHHWRTDKNPEIREDYDDRKELEDECDPTAR